MFTFSEGKYWQNPVIIVGTTLMSRTNPLSTMNGVDEEIGDVKRRRARLILRWGTSLNVRINS